MIAMAKNKVAQFVLKIFLIFFCLLIWNIEFGTKVANAKAGVGITPSKFELSLDTGDRETVTVTLINQGTHPMKVDLSKWDFARDKYGRAYPIKPKEAKKFHACGAWVTFPTRSFTIPSGEQKKFQFAVEVPRDAESGTYHAYVRARATPVLSKEEMSEKEGVVVPIVTSLDGLLLVTVGGEENKGAVLTRSAEIKSFSVDPINLGSPITIETRFKNSGNVHLNLKGTVKIYSGENLEKTIDLPQYTLLPKSNLTVPVSWQPSVLFGKFTAKLDANVGLDKPLKEKKDFWVVSWKPLLVIVLGITAIAAGLLVFFKKYKVQLSPKS